MTRRLSLWFWLVLVALIIAGVWRLRFDVEVLNLLPDDVPAVHGLKLYQQHFANARELMITVRAGSAEETEGAAGAIAGKLRSQTNLVASVTWQPPWLEHPEQTAELIAHLWFNQPPAVFLELTNRLAAEKIAGTLTATRDQLASSMSPGDIARLSYDPLGLTQLPESVAGAAPAFTEGQNMFSSEDGTFRLLFVKAAIDLTTYRECKSWLQSVETAIAEATGTNRAIINYTGRPVFVAEISQGMEHDIRISVGGTAVIIAFLFWLAHRRIKPMLWLLTLLALILGGTLALGGLIFGAINVVSMGFAAILLGLAVDYAVVHYQEAIAQPELMVPEIRRAIAPSIFWAAVTTISAFLVLNFGGLPGLAQLGTLVGVGVGLSAFVMIFCFLPPLFPERRQRPGAPASGPARTSDVRPAGPAAGAPQRIFSSRTVFMATAALVLFCGITLLSGLPRMDPTADSLRPRNSQAYATLDLIKRQLGQKREPLWLLVGGRNESEVARHLDAVQLVLSHAVSNNVLAGFTLPSALWPRPEFQVANRPAAQHFASERERIRGIVLSNGFTETSFGLTEGILRTWERAAATPGVFWPTNDLNRWIIEKLTARGATNFYALGLLELPEPAAPGGDAALARLAEDLPRDQVWLSGWELLGHSILGSVKANLWKLVLPIAGLILLSLWLAFGRPVEILLSLTILFLSGLIVLAVMQLAGWSWNLLNLMALPLILGTGVDYSIFMQLALRRHHGDLGMAHFSVGRALLLCGGTAVAGFGALTFSTNAGMASLGQVCAIGIGANMLISVYLLPVWWKRLTIAPDQKSKIKNQKSPGPSSLYRPDLWQIGLGCVRILPRSICLAIAHAGAEVYWAMAPSRCRVIIETLAPALNNDPVAAKNKARALLHQFVVKLVDLWRYEAGLPIENFFGAATGWEHFASALAQKRGVLLLTPHLGNWEFGGPWLTQKGVALQVVTLAEPGDNFTELRQASRARWKIDTLVIGNDPFAFVEIIRRLEAGATVALLVDRPPPATAVTVELFGRPFAASIAAAELARASGCVLLPVYLPREGDKYAAHVLPPIPYDRASLRDPAARQELTQEIVRAFEPVIRQHLDQWYHFVPIWPK